MIQDQNAPEILLKRDFHQQVPNVKEIVFSVVEDGDQHIAVLIAILIKSGEHHVSIAPRVR